MASDLNAQAHLLFDIPFSHFCEKARWALAYYGVSYSQKLLVPVFHMATVGRTVRNQEISPTRTASRGTPNSVPLLIVLDAALKPHLLLHDSHDILVYLSDTRSSSSRPNLYASCGPERTEEIVALERHYDETLGPATRAWAYYELLVLNKWRSMIPFAAIGFTNGLGLVHSLAWFLCSPFIGRIIPPALRINMESYENAIKICRDEFEKASQRLDHSEYLSGPNLSASDVTFATLAYPVLGITHKEGFTQFPPAPIAFRSAAKAFRKDMRATKAGQHVIRLFKEKQKMDKGIVIRKKKSLFGLW